MATVGAAVEGNVSESSQTLRMRVGVAAFAIGLVMGAILLKMDVAPIWRALVAIPFAFAGQGIASSVCKTCSIMAAKGLREGEDGAEQICCPRQRASIKALGYRALFSGAAVTALMTLPFVLIG